MRAKLGLIESRTEDIALFQNLLELMAQSGADYTNTFRALGRFRGDSANARLRDRFIERSAFDAWAKRYATRLAAEGSVAADRERRMNRVNPKYILRNYLAQNAIEKASRDKDFSEVDRLLDLLRNPFAERPEREDYAAEPPDWGRHIEVSCSS